MNYRDDYEAAAGRAQAAEEALAEERAKAAASDEAIAALQREVDESRALLAQLKGRLAQVEGHLEQIRGQSASPVGPAISQVPGPAGLLRPLIVAAAVVGLAAILILGLVAPSTGVPHARTTRGAAVPDAAPTPRPDGAPPALSATDAGAVERPESDVAYAPVGQGKTLVAQARRAEKASKWDEALALLERVAPGDAAWQEALILKADVLASKNQAPKALAVLDSLLAKYPSNADAWKARGAFLMDSNPAEAMRSLQRYLDLRPGAADADRVRAAIESLRP